MNLVALLEEQASRHPRRPALITARGELTFEQLRERSARLATGLCRAGLEEGDRAIVMVPMSSELYVVLLALWRLGAVAVFADPWVGVRQMARLAAHARPRAFVGGAKAHLLRFLEPRLRRLPITVDTGRGLVARHSLRSLLAASAPEDGVVDIAAVRSEDSALVTLTGGSSGEPKGADRTHGFLRAQHEVLAREFPLQGDDVEMTTLPIFALQALAQGHGAVIPQLDLRRIDRFDARRVLDQAEAAGVTTLTASPPFFDRLAEHLEKNRRPRFSPRRILSGGAVVADAQLRAWRRAFPRAEIVAAYGSTEVEPVAHIRAEERLELAGSRLGYCVGRPVDGLATKLRPLREGAGAREGTREGEREDKSERIGELVVSGAHVCRGYFRCDDGGREQKTRGDVGRPWHRMGDTGFFDGEGRFWIAGRVHSTIFRRGRTVHAQLVERAARGGDIRIRRVAAVGVPDARLGERVVVALELMPSTTAADRRRIVAAIARRLDAAGQPHDEIVIRRRALPLDPRHRSKIDYERLRRQLEGRKWKGTAR